MIFLMMKKSAGEMWANVYRLIMRGLSGSAVVVLRTHIQNQTCSQSRP